MPNTQPTDFANMHKKIIASTSTHSVGCTFLDWSILFLSGQDNFFRSKSNSLETLTHDPVTALNAHGHKRNHPPGFKLTQQCVETFLNSPHELLTLYPCLIFHQVASKELKISDDQIGDQEINLQIINHQHEDFSRLVDYLLAQEASLIYIDHNLPIFSLEPRSIDKTFRGSEPAKSTTDITNKMQSVYFSKSIEQWTQLGLVDIWDVREQQALNTRPLEPIVKPTLNLTQPHCFIDSQEWLTDSTTTIKRIMDFCKLSIDSSRWDQWVLIQNKWRTTYQQHLTFDYQLPHIVDAIINNWYYEIDLSFNQEVVVQHCLIYQHNLNLKSWQLTKFPSNTQELHKLLEDNIHPL